MYISDFARALILGVILVVYWMDALEWWVLCFTSFGLGMFSAVFNPAKDAIVPDLSSSRMFMRINSFFQTSAQIAIIAGTGLSALFLGLTRQGGQAGDVPRLVGLFAIDAVSFLISALFIMAIRMPPVGEPLPGTQPQFRGQFARMIRWIREDSLLAGLLFVTAVDNLFIMGPAVVGSNLFIRDTLGKGPEAVALFDFVLAFGMFFSSAILLKWGDSIPKGKLTLVGIVFDGMTFLPFFWIRDYRLMLVAVFIHSFSIPMIIIPRTSLIQENIHRSRLSQAFSLINLTIFGFWSVSGLLTGWLTGFLVQFVGIQNAPPTMYLIAGIGGILCGLGGFSFQSLRKAV